MATDLAARPASTADRAVLLPVKDRLWWAIGVFVLLGTLGLGLGLAYIKTVPRVYQADATVILLVDQSSSGNPYTYFPKSVILTAQAVAQFTRQGSVRDALVARGALRDYQVDVQNDGNQWVPIYSRPNITVSVQSTDAPEAQLTVELVVKQVTAELARAQEEAGVVPAARIGSQILRSPDASPVNGRPSRAAVAVLMLSFWLAVLGFNAVRRSALPGRRRSDNRRLSRRPELLNRHAST